MGKGKLIAEQQLTASFNFNIYTKAEADAKFATKEDTYTKAEVDSLVDEKADSSSVYTKIETDALLNEKADIATTYTKTETNNLLNGKADKSTTLAGYGITDAYTKTQTDNLLNGKADTNNIYTKEETDNLLSVKANSADVYTKAETDNLLSAKADSANVYTKTEADTLLAGKADTEAITEAVEIAQDAKNTADNAETIANDAMDVAQAERESAQEAAQEANQAATNAANSASSASTTATQLMEYLATKEEITAPAVDPTLTISGAAADAKVTGDNVFYISDNLGIYAPVSRLINHAGGSIAAANSVTSVVAKSGDTLNYRISGTAFPSTITKVNFYLRNTDGTLAYINKSNINQDLSITLPYDITGIAIYQTNLVAGTIVIEAQRIVDKNRIKQINSNTKILNNILNGYEYDGEPTTRPGYWNANGDYRNPAPTEQEVTTDPYYLYDGIQFDIDVTLNNGTNSFWMAYSAFDSTGTFLRRVNVANNVQTDRYQGSVVINDPGIAYIEFSYRTYGDATAIISADLKFIKEINDKIDNIEVNADPPSLTVPNIAHRGDDISAPQCTAPAYIAAKKRGFSIAENDLFLSQDGVLVMWHDTTLGKLGNMVDINGYLMYTDGTNYYWVHPTTNTVYTWDGTNYIVSSVDIATLTRCNGSNYSVNNMFVPTSIGLNFDVLRRIDFGVWKGSQFAGTQILTFEEWILLCKQLDIGAYVDRKLTYTDALLTEAGNTVKRLGMGEYTSWLGLNVNQINLLRTIIPHARCGILTHPTAQNVVSYAPYNVDGKFFFNGDAKNGMTAEAVHLGLDAGFEVEVWYVDYGTTTEEQILAKIREAVSYGVTGITLDHYRTNDAFAYLLE